MRVGFYFTVRPQDGGEYQYACTLLENLLKIHSHEYLVYYTEKRYLPKLNFQKPIRFVRLPQSDSLGNRFLILARTLLFRLGPLDRRHPLASESYQLLTSLLGHLFQLEINTLVDSKPQLLVYPVSTLLSFLVPVPAIVAIHDLQHRIQPQFKEVTAHGKARQRDYLYTMITSQAVSILVDSETGKKHVFRYYPQTRGKVYPLPYLPPSILAKKLQPKQETRSLKQLSLPSRYLLYPAKYWPHKNHFRLIRALAILKKRGLQINLILTGSTEAEYSTFEEILSLVAILNLGDQVKFLGYLSETDLALVYRHAFALILPTFFGPTNIPILEAWQAGIPVLCSNYDGSQEQLGSAGLRFNPRSSKDIARKIEMLIKQPKLRRKLVRHGKQRLRLWSPEKLQKELSIVLRSSVTITADERYRQP